MIYTELPWLPHRRDCWYSGAPILVPQFCSSKTARYPHIYFSTQLSKHSLLDKQKKKKKRGSVLMNRRESPEATIPAIVKWPRPDWLAEGRAHSLLQEQLPAPASVPWFCGIRDYPLPSCTGSRLHCFCMYPHVCISRAKFLFPGTNTTG